MDLVTEEENKMNNTLGYDMSSIGEETNSHNQVNEEAALNLVEQDMELFLPTVNKFGAVKRYKSKIMKKVKKQRIENVGNGKW